MTVQYDNLTGTILNKVDGNTADNATATAPRVAVIGQAGKGQGSLPYFVQTTALAKSEFGSEGNLIRGMFEAKDAGAEEIYLYRIGAESATVSGIGNSTGGAGGYIVSTVMEDADAGSSYALYYDDTENRLVVIRNTDSLVVYDNSQTAPIDRYEVIVSGYRNASGGDNIGSPSSFVNLEDVSATGTTYTAGTDGLDLSRMELFEKIYVAYKHLKEYNFDVCIPMDVYLDDMNTVDQGPYIGAQTPLTNGGANSYPEAGLYQPGTNIDSLGMVYVENYEGTDYFWWRFATSGTTADIYPVGIASATATTKTDGTALVDADFHEVNFAYQLGRFLYEYSTNIVDATGVIGVLPPESASITDRARWLGQPPSWTQNNLTGEWYIASETDNGNGLRGNKFMVGRYDHRAGIFGGGFIATDGEFLDSGSEVVDENDVPIDLGKYISVVADTLLFRNNFAPNGYISSYAASYGGKYSNMPPASSPANKKVDYAQIIYRQNLDAIDGLAGDGYVVLRNKPQGLVVGAAPMATMPDSDWRNLSTVRIVKSVVDGVREATEPFLGEGLSQAQRGGLQLAIETVLLNAKRIGVLRDYRPFEIIQTPQMAVAGKATVKLTVVPAWELKQLELTVAVARS